MRSYPQAKVSFSDFKHLVSAVEPHRAERLINFDAFLAMKKKPNTIVLDSRSRFRFDRIHLAGARHLAFTDFTQENLAKVIPAFDTTVLIYCNNNFEGDEVDFATKIVRPESMMARRFTTQLQSQEKPRMMALNVPTYLNLFGYGYEQVFELDELLNVSDPRVVFEGTLAGVAPALRPPALKE